MRKGRLDEIFFVDLPSHRERRDIVTIHLQKRRRDPGSVDLDALAARCDGFSGAEIEQAIVSAMFDAFETETALSTELIEKSFRETVPLSRTMAEDINGLREWAAGRARPASTVEGETVQQAASRKFEL